MTENNRSNTGYGSTYEKSDSVKGEGIPSVLGGQVWKVKPDKAAPVDNPCLWMAAGVVKFKNCNNFDDCCNCKYDQAMQKAAEAGKNPTWQEAMRMRSKPLWLFAPIVALTVAGAALLVDITGHDRYDIYRAGQGFGDPAVWPL